MSVAKAFSSKSHIVKHWMYCLSHQEAEALIINHSKDVLLNSKGEYVGNSIIRLVVEEESWERKKRAREEEEQENLAKKKVEEFIRLKSSIQEEGRVGEQAGEDDSPDENAGFGSPSFRSISFMSWHEPHAVIFMGDSPVL